MKKIALISAMVEEIQPILDEFQPLALTTINYQTIYFVANQEIEIYIFNTGIGKTNAAITTSLAISQFNFDLIINIGTCGAIKPGINVGDFILPNKLAYFDVDATTFGYSIGQIPRTNLYEEIDITKFSQWLAPLNLGNIYSGTLMTGDSFVDDHNINNFNWSAFIDPVAVEMESMSIVYTAHQLNTPIYVLRTVSDNANEESNVSFDQYLNTVSQQYLSLFKYILTNGGDLVE